MSEFRSRCLQIYLSLNTWSDSPPDQTLHSLHNPLGRSLHDTASWLTWHWFLNYTWFYFALNGSDRIMHTCIGEKRYSHPIAAVYVQEMLSWSQFSSLPIYFLNAETWWWQLNLPAWILTLISPVRTILPFAMPCKKKQQYIYGLLEVGRRKWQSNSRCISMTIDTRTFAWLQMFKYQP